MRPDASRYNGSKLRRVTQWIHPDRAGSDMQWSTLAVITTGLVGLRTEGAWLFFFLTLLTAFFLQDYLLSHTGENDPQSMPPWVTHATCAFVGQSPISAMRQQCQRMFQPGGLMIAWMLL